MSRPAVKGLTSLCMYLQCQRSIMPYNVHNTSDTSSGKLNWRTQTQSKRKSLKQKLKKSGLISTKKVVR